MCSYYIYSLQIYSQQVAKATEILNFHLVVKGGGGGD